MKESDRTGGNMTTREKFADAADAIADRIDAGDSAAGHYI